MTTLLVYATADNPLEGRVAFTIGECATLLGVSHSSVRRAIADKRLTAICIGGARNLRIPGWSLRALLEEAEG